MKVRATQDGIYAGYYRYGPITTDMGTRPGDVFEISDKPKPKLDADGKMIPVMIKKTVPVETWKRILDKNGQTMLDKNGNPMVERDVPTSKDEFVQATDKDGTPLWEINSDFAPEWMVKVPDNTPITYKYPPFKVPVPYRAVEDDMEQVIMDIPVPAGAPGNMPAPKIFG